MVKYNYKLLQSILFLFLSVLPSNYADDHQLAERLQSYIVHVDPSPDSDPNSILTSDEQRELWYMSFLPHESRLIYSYHDAVSGFAARLTEEELAEIEKKPGFVHAYLDRIVHLQTTHTPKFLGLDRNEPGLWKDSNFGKGVIVGVLDTGISPDLPSFHDNGAIPPPSNKWQGGCDFDATLCNNKLIGAKNFVRGMNAMRPSLASSLQAAPFDTEGHGTHTASTAAAMFVDNANIEGQASGTAAGMAPYAHLAIYKVCSELGCANSDILAAMDKAISDGVDVLSLSLGGSSLPYHKDGIAIGAFAAMARGIFVSCAGGNAGPSPRSLSNEAPWMLTVGASSVDRKIKATVRLGNGKELEGESVHQPSNYLSPLLPLVFPSADCASLAGVNVKGKIVVCNGSAVTSRLDKGKVVKAAGGAGMILPNHLTQGFTSASMDVHVLPAATVSYVDGLNIKAYINSSSRPTASIRFKGTVIGQSSVVAPAVAYFSSRGPNQADPAILKPDIIGPGVAILAAWPFDIGTPGAKYNMISGTSMATPHLSGIAAILKSAHPDWSPAAIKSAIMTTASKYTNNGGAIPDQNLNKADFFAIGAGHVDPVAANDPGLIYDLNEKDYISYLCGLRYTNAQVRAVARSRISCSDYTLVSGSELNYPSFMVFVSYGDNVTVTRTVTNVGLPRSSYTVDVIAPVGASVTVKPKKLRFKRLNQKRQFVVTFTGKGSAGNRVHYSEGHLTWVSSHHKVSSPIMIAVGAGKVQSV